jgi:hypothetical protein
MSLSLHTRWHLRGVSLLIAGTIVWMLSSDAARAQGGGVTRINWFGAGTARSAEIFAQSELYRSQGEFLVSASAARKQNAEAASMEMDNSIKWVKTYFERRRLNREYRAAENPSYLDRAESRNKTYYRLIDRNSETVLASDVTDTMNWMVRDLLAHSSYETFLVTYPGSLANSPDNIPLSAAEKHHLRLSEGKNVGGKVMIFRADTAQVLETRWPMALRDERFDSARANFEAARDSALAELKVEKKLSRPSESRLMKAVDQLSDELSAAYPRERRNSSSAVFFEYLTSKRFLQSLALATCRLIETQSEVAFDESYRFQGENLAALLQHMMTKGLEFAPPEGGDEGTYRYLFQAIRALYLKAVPKPAENKTAENEK